VQVQELTGFFDDARAYWTAKKAGAAIKADLKFEAMIPVLEGKVPLVAFAAREREIKEAIEFAEKQSVKLVLAGIRKPGATLDAIAKKKIPVILGRTQVETDEEDDPYDEPYTLPSKLNEAGVKFCFGTFDEQFARNLPYQASQGVPFGLPYDAALRSVTLSAAEIWGIDKDYGSIEAGKVADLVVTDGDLLEVKTNVKMLSSAAARWIWRPGTRGFTRSTWRGRNCVRGAALQTAQVCAERALESPRGRGRPPHSG